ncbi:hypothetical protein [Nocardioides humi]|uniref:YbaB/EbfC DNA-binding family protein n=1 Tax=Nocardioides humi TaxID=449461 RepID=A0ABN1ZTX1_9ACTN|nr:hypothetical protein [Nocardioides humi]
METPIEMMYRAAKKDIPAEADHLTRLTNKLQASLATLNVEAAHAGDPAVLTSMLHVGGDMHAVLGRAVTTMDNCSVAIKITADDYVATDAQAKADFDAMSDELKNTPMPTPHETTELPNPEAPGYDVEVPPPYGPPGTTHHVDAEEDPTPPSEDQSDRGDGGENQPDVPDVDRNW